MHSDRTETELKLRVRPDDVARLRQEPRFAGSFRAGAPQLVESVYFDSAERILRTRGFVLRLRRVGDERIQTIKSVGPSTDWLNRQEWEQVVGGERPDFANLADTPLGAMLTEDVRASLQPIFTTRVERASYALDTPAAGILMVIDTGEIVAGDAAVPLSEIELELKRGSAAELFKLARDIAAVVPVQLEVKSKAERGYALADGGKITAEKARDPRLSADAAAGQAFTLIGHACLRHLLANECGVLACDAESLHQARVALRRLRAAISLFADLLKDDRVDAVKAELRWIAQQIGPARDLDVFIIEALTPLRREHKDRGLASIAKTFARMRLKRYGDARAAVQSDRFRNALLDVAEWLEAGPWTTSREPRVVACRDMPVEALAAQQLSRLRKKIRRRGADFDHLDPEQLHRLRIRVKKARYAVDFLSGLYGGKKAERRRRKFQSSLARLQDCLGGLNDIEMRKAMCTSVLSHAARGLTEEQRRLRAFAVGLIIGDQQARRHGLRVCARKACARFNRAKRFWRRPSQPGAAPPASPAPGVRDRARPDTDVSGGPVGARQGWNGRRPNHPADDE